MNKNQTEERKKKILCFLFNLNNYLLTIGSKEDRTKITYNSDSEIATIERPYLNEKTEIDVSNTNLRQFGDKLYANI